MGDRGHKRAPKGGGGTLPLSLGEVGHHVTQCGQGRGPPVGEVSSESSQPFGHSTPTLQTDETGQDNGPIVQGKRYTYGCPETSQELRVKRIGAGEIVVPSQLDSCIVRNAHNKVFGSKREVSV